jgi:hypothetical protein
MASRISGVIGEKLAGPRRMYQGEGGNDKQNSDGDRSSNLSPHDGLRVAVGSAKGWPGHLPGVTDTQTEHAFPTNGVATITFTCT